MNKVPLLAPLAGVIAGALCVYHYPQSYAYAVLVGAAVTFVLLWKKRYGLFPLLLGVMLGSLAMKVGLPRTVDLAQLNSLRQPYSAVVTKITQNARGLRLFASVDSVGDARVKDFNVYLWSGQDSLRLLPGDRINFSGRLAAPDTASRLFLPSNHQKKARNAAQSYSLTDYLRHNGLSALALPRHLDITAEGSGLDTYFARQRSRLSHAITASGLNAPTAAFLDAILTGDQQHLTPQIRQQFQRTGLAHVLALSGTHVAVLAFLLARLLSPLRLMGQRRLSYLVAIPALWGYALLTGMSPSVVRAALMSTFVFGAWAFGRESQSINALSCAAILILVFSVFALFAVGFWLSFAAVAAILLFSEVLPVPAWKPRLHGRLKRLSSPLRTAFGECWRWVVVCVAAVTGTMPITAYAFGQFPACFLLTNIPVVLCLPAFMICGLMLLGLTAAGLPCPWIIAAMDGAFSGLQSFMVWVQTLPGAFFQIPAFSPWLMLPAYGAIGAVWLALRRRRPAFLLGSGLLAAFTAALSHLL